MARGRASVIEERGVKYTGRSRIGKRGIAGAGFGGWVSVEEGIAKSPAVVIAKHGCESA